MLARLVFLLTLLAPAEALFSGDAIPLIEPDSGKVWKFNNGAEFPGATGSLTLVPDARNEKPALKLVGDFTGGGGYVQAGRDLPKADIRELSMWVKNPDSGHFTLRLNDATGQTHQIDIKTEVSPDWQLVSLPLERFFERRGQADAVTTIQRYQSWGGAKDGNWHGPAKAIYLLLGNHKKNSVQTLWLSDVMIHPKPLPVEGAEMKTVIDLGEHADWGFSNGAEFGGATGSLEPGGDGVLKLAGDFTGGGAYVAAIRNLESHAMTKAPLLKMELKSSNAESVTVQLVDGSGQTHQRRGFPVKADGEWHEVEIRPEKHAGGEHWGGANDGEWHGGIRQFVVSVTKGSDKKKNRPVLLLRKVRAEVLVPVFARKASLKTGFDSDSGWTFEGGASVDGSALRLTRKLENVNAECSAESPRFAASPGQWQVKLHRSADLHSPDNSYNAVVRLDCLGADGSVLERIPVTEVFGKHSMEEVSTVVEAPPGTAAARFHVRLNKTYGEFRMDDLEASYLAPALRKDDRISRLLFSTAQLGNLLFPDDTRVIDVTVEARKELESRQLEVTAVVRDYWGSEHTRPLSSLLEPAGKNQRGFLYNGRIDLSGARLETGRYYEVHASVPGSDAQTEPFSNHTSLAILPEAVTKNYKPEEIPFNSRNWDNRIQEYIRLTDRLGIRICGLWGGWSHEPPYKAQAPGLDLCRELGMGWLSNTPAATIERGKTDYDEKALREGVRNLIETFGHERPMFINLGNEPHGKGDVVLRNVAAYKALYEEIKKVAPDITVIATSVEPNEEYFKAGYGQYCDAFDFHIYETAENVRRTMREYRALMRKYDVEKPIWSTELGLNSQGQPRRTVAIEVFKKLSSFFAEGGQNVSWFGLLYPDGDGKSHGSSGDSHNVFDCRYNRYCPRLDAVAYYNIVNAISIKKFIAEKTYDDGTHIIHFRDREGRNLQVIWNEETESDLFLPLSGTGKAKVIRLDGRRAEFDVSGGGIALRATNDPALVLYDGKAGLPAKPATSSVSLTPTDNPLTFKLSGKAAVTAPPFWKVETKGELVSLTPPVDSAVRQVEITVKPETQGGELVYLVPLQE